GASEGVGGRPPDQLGPRAGHNAPDHAAGGSARPGGGRSRAARSRDIRRSVLKAIRLLLADDHVLVRQGLRALLEQAEMVVVGEASDGPEALRLAHTHQPDLA